MSLPAPVGDGQGGALGLVFGSAGGAFNLNLRLSALENNGVVKTISAPKIATIDNREATIGQGISIPFSQVSASGVNTTFIEAKLELKVTPHVTADGSILLKIKATNNQPNPQLTGANGQPSISKREAETEVLVKDGETTVIGGIYTRQTAQPHERGAVPREAPAARLLLPEHERAGRPHRAAHLHHSSHPEPGGHHGRRGQLGATPMKTRLAALALAAVALACADNSASIEPYAICSPPDDAAPVQLGVRPAVHRAARARHLGEPAAPIFLQVNNQLPMNDDLSAGRVNTNDAYVTEYEVEYEGAASGSSMGRRSPSCPRAAAR